MDVQVVSPTSLDLRACVDCIYFLRHNHGDSARYISFPSVFTNLSLIRQAKVEHSDENIHITGNRSTGLVQIFRKNLLKPCLVTYSGMVEEVTIFFRPLGMQHFPLLNDRITATDRFILSETAATEDTIWEPVWKASNPVERLASIESILGRYWQPFAHGFLDQAIARLAADPALTTGLLAHHLGISRKTLHIHFEKYLGLSPSQYRRITRFRNAVREKMVGGKPQTLTELAYSMDFPTKAT